MAQRQPTWRLSGAEAVYVAPGADHPSTAAGPDTRLGVTCRPRYQPFREALSNYTDDLVAILPPGDRHDTFPP